MDWVVAEPPSAYEAVRPNGALRAWRAQGPDVLGTRLNVVAVAAHEATALTAARAMRGEIARLDCILNGRDPTSELARWSAGPGGGVSADLFDVLQAAERWRLASGGAFDARLGAAAALWEASRAPNAAELAQALAGSRGVIGLDRKGRTAIKPGDLSLALDGLAKGYILDRAMEAARRAAPDLSGALIEIGGDMRCWGLGPDGGRWRVEVVHPGGCREVVEISNAAIATSGLGPRDQRAGGLFASQTLSPRSGHPVAANMSASAIAPCATDADALATAFLVMKPQAALALAETLPGVGVRLTDEAGRAHVGGAWRMAQARTKPIAPPPSSVPPALRWPGDWGIEIVYVAPDRQDVRDVDFRSPYMALWIADAANRPIRTITMVGKDPEWQRDNFIWWSSYRPGAERMVELRSEATALSGRYSLFWRGVDDAWNALPIGDYVLHIETSQERGKHTHRTLPLKIGRQPFAATLPASREGGGLQITYGLKR